LRKKRKRKRKKNLIIIPFREAKTNPLVRLISKPTERKTNIDDASNL
jgi:hypothetical protein